MKYKVSIGKTGITMPEIVIIIMISINLTNDSLTLLTVN